LTVLTPAFVQDPLHNQDNISQSPCPSDIHTQNNISQIIATNRMYKRDLALNYHITVAISHAVLVKFSLICSPELSTYYKCLDLIHQFKLKKVHVILTAKLQP
jgi:hypothetical protein